jgi:hypothetical protein
MPVEIKKMYQEWKANMVATEGRAAFAIRQNRKYGTPTQFTAAAVPITAVHFGSNAKW